MISAWAAAAREPGASAVRFMRIGVGGVQRRTLIVPHLRILRVIFTDHGDVQFGSLLFSCIVSFPVPREIADAKVGFFCSVWKSR